MYRYANLSCVRTRACTAFQSCSPLHPKIARGCYFEPHCPWSCKHYVRSLRVSDLEEYTCLLHARGFSGEDPLVFCPRSLRTVAHLCNHRVQVSGEYLCKSSTLSRTPYQFSQPFWLPLGSAHARHAALQPAWDETRHPFVAHLGRYPPSLSPRSKSVSRRRAASVCKAIMRQPIRVVVL